MKDIIIFLWPHHLNNTKLMVASWQCIFKPWNQLRLYFWRILCLFMFSVPRDDFPIGLAHFSCMKLICHKIHPSFINKMNERCVALVLLVDGSKIDNIFKDAKSLALICILPSCDFYFLIMSGTFWVIVLWEKFPSWRRLGKVRKLQI